MQKQFCPRQTFENGINFMGFGILPKSVIFSEKLTLAEKLVYAEISCHANEKGEAFPSVETIKKDLKIGVKRVQKSIKNLCKTHFLKVKKSGRHNVYTLLAEEFKTGRKDAKNFGLLPKALLKDARLSPAAKAIYCVHAVISGSKLTNFLSVRRIMDVLGIRSQTTYYAHNRALIAANYLVSEQRYDTKSGRYGVNDHYLAQNPKPEGADVKMKTIARGFLDGREFRVERKIRFVKNLCKKAACAVKNKISSPQKTADFLLRENAVRTRNPVCSAAPEPSFIKEKLAANFELEWYENSSPQEFSQVSELYKIALEMACSKGGVRVANRIFSAETVRERMFELDQSHVGYILGCLEENAEKGVKIGNIKEYLKSCLWNAPATMDSYYANKVRCDGVV
jgi:hypothetical protein